VFFENLLGYTTVAGLKNKKCRNFGRCKEVIENHPVIS
jgi:hypothetical protein